MTLKKVASFAMNEFKLDCEGPSPSITPTYHQIFYYTTIYNDIQQKNLELSFHRNRYAV